MELRRYSVKYPHFLGQQPPALLLDAMARSQPGVLLDVGCGDGSLLHALCSSGVADGWRVLGLDTSRERIQRVRELGLGVECRVGDACTLEGVDDESVDLLVTTQVIEHVPDDGAMVAAIGRVLKPKGLAYMSTVFKTGCGVYWHRCNGRWVLDPTHLREYSHDGQLLDLLRAHELRPVVARKTPVAFSLVDPVMRLARLARDTAVRHRAIQIARTCRIRIPGYYNWEIVAEKGDASSAVGRS